MLEIEVELGDLLLSVLSEKVYIFNSKN